MRSKYLEGDRIYIPTEQQFIEQFRNWTYKEVQKHFKFNRDRVPETVQDIMIRFLSKKFIGRWFYKHLTNELVDRSQAEKILGGAMIAQFNPKLLPCAVGLRGDPGSLWRISDILKFAKFDFERFYYSPQGHTIDSDKILRLLGYEAGVYTPLQSLWRQGRLSPAEKTEHECSGKKCKQCKTGLAYLNSKKLTPASSWVDPTPSHLNDIKKMRWNDSQLIPFLRNWRRQNGIIGVPEYIIRLEPNPGIQAGLLQYSKNLIRNEVANCFKRMMRGDDASSTVFNKGMSPGFSNDELIAYESDDQDQPTRTIRDVGSASQFQQFENQLDASRLLDAAELTKEELHVLEETDLGDMTARELSTSEKTTFQKVHRLRGGALKKIKNVVNSDDGIFDRIMATVCGKHDCNSSEILSKLRFGKHIVARADLFYELNREGIPIEIIARIYGFDIDRVYEAIQRHAGSISATA